MLSVGYGLELVDFRRKNEITFGEPVDFVGPRGDFRFAPREQYVRMMPLLLGHGTDFVDERKGLQEIRKPE